MRLSHFWNKLWSFFFKENGGLVNSTGGKFNLVRKLNKDKLTFEDVARKLLVRFDEILLRNCREEPARRSERII